MQNKELDKKLDSCCFSPDPNNKKKKTKKKKKSTAFSLVGNILEQVNEGIFG
ncbi:MAG: hypothetical protein MI922_30460 [Bacteroidales bacterium]|nr:hypothetical protein [Bacteroidales bacterium]